MDDSIEIPESPLFMDPETSRCPQATYGEMLARCPVSRMPITKGLIIAGYEDVMYCLRHPEIFSSEMSEQMALGTQRPMIPQQIDPPNQTRYRKILDPQFSRKKMALIEPAIRKSAIQMIEPLLDQGACDFNQDFAVPLPCESFLHLMGLPAGDLDLLIHLKDGIIRPQSRAQNAMDGEEINRIRKSAGDDIYLYFEDLIKEREAAPRDDLMGHLLRAEVDGERLSHNEILDIAFLFILAGLDTVTATLNCSVAYLASNPGQQEKLTQNPALIEKAIEEMMRWETPVTGVPRLVKQDVKISGHEIKAGEMVLLLLGSANVDPHEFDQPELVDFERARNRHIAFGSGPHRCLGSHLARMELKVALEEWHKRIPSYRLANDTPLIFSAGIRDVEALPLAWS
ncbi:MAG: cytochrome [Deltaproteobacteria bacterium]|nr:cytochrome [Deltaproteobacteria bacterium]